MKARLFWLASVLVAASAFSTNVARAADDVVIHATSESCPSCGTGSKFHFGAGLFHRKSSCSACGDHAWLNWHPGQVISDAHACASAKLHSIKDGLHFPAPTCAGAKAAQPIPPTYMYNPYYRSPRDYFMSEH